MEIQSLDFLVSFFVKKKRKENRLISQIEIIVRVMNLIRILIVGTKVYTYLYNKKRTTKIKIIRKTPGFLKINCRLQTVLNSL
jgi:hypothetical protein